MYIQETDAADPANIAGTLPLEEYLEQSSRVGSVSVWPRRKGGSSMTVEDTGNHPALVERLPVRHPPLSPATARSRPRRLPRPSRPKPTMV